MRANVGVFLMSVLLAGCAAYKELEPKPELFSRERGYIELKNDKENFKLDKDAKYFIKFPQPEKDRFYLVLTTNVKPALRYYLTNTFDDGEGKVVQIPDEAAASDSVSFFAIDTKAPTFYWVIDEVRQDLELSMKYRYVPQWRYTFETKSDQFQEILVRNSVDRSTYNSIDVNYSLETFEFMREIANVSERTNSVKAMRRELLKLEALFPANIASTNDTAYQKYTALRGAVDNEIGFQENYVAVLSLFKKEQETRGSVSKFLDAVPYFTEVLSQRDRFPFHIVEKERVVFQRRLGEIGPYLDGLLRSKNDINKISPAPPASAVAGLYSACGQQIPRDTEVLLGFIARFNLEAEALQGASVKFNALKTFFQKNITAPPPAFYTDLLAKARELSGAIPESQSRRFEKYGSYACASMLNSEITKATSRATDLQNLYLAAGQLTSQIEQRTWAAAEVRLRALADDRTYLEFNDVAEEKNLLVKRFENDIFTGVKLASQQRVDAFVKAHEMTIDGVPALYEDSVFSPVYQLTFSSMGSADLAQKRRQIDSYLERMKYVQFPENSIKGIYKEFIRTPNDRGVEKARAIVDHGKSYRGDDKQVKAFVDECNPQAAKWVVKPKEYRRMFVLPTTSNKRGSNDYVFRIRLNIPSEAEFPVFDITIKLPSDLAGNAGKEQWYDQITINKKPLKNEGRFRITSPTAENNYESLITPVQMDKEGNNILEVRFRYPGFRVFEVSAMAQVPLIRKN